MAGLTKEPRVNPCSRRRTRIADTPYRHTGKLSLWSLREKSRWPIRLDSAHSSNSSLRKEVAGYVEDATQVSFGASARTPVQSELDGIRPRQKLSARSAMAGASAVVLDDEDANPGRNLAIDNGLRGARGREASSPAGSGRAEPGICNEEPGDPPNSARKRAASAGELSRG